MLYKTIIKILLIIIISLLVSIDLLGSSDIVINFTLYEGDYLKKKAKNKQELKPFVSTYYYFPPDTYVGTNPGAKETKSFYEVLSRTNMKEITRVNWTWKRREQTKKFQIFTWNGKIYRVEISPTGEKDCFSLRIAKENKKKGVLDTKLTIPEGSGVTLGGGSKGNKLHIFSFRNLKQQKAAEDGIISASPEHPPKLINGANPVFPPAAVGKFNKGTVHLDLVVDEKGNVSAVEKIRVGQAYLKDAAYRALKQWTFQPYLKDGVPHKVKFSIVAVFYLD